MKATQSKERTKMMGLTCLLHSKHVYGSTDPQYIAVMQSACQFSTKDKKEQREKWICMIVNRMLLGCERGRITYVFLTLPFLEHISNILGLHDHELFRRVFIYLIPENNNFVKIYRPRRKRETMRVAKEIVKIKMIKRRVS